LECGDLSPLLHVVQVATDRTMTIIPSDDISQLGPAVVPLPTSGLPAACVHDARGVSTVGVLHVINGEHYAGAERVQDLLAMRLPEFGFHVGFACVKPKGFAEARQSRQSPIYKVPMRSRLDLRAAWTIARIARREGYRLIHGHTVRTALVGRLAAALAGVPMVYHVHSPTSRNTNRPLLNRVNAVIEKLSLSGVSRLIAVSESLARHIEQQGFDSGKITVVHNGVPRVERLPSRTTPFGCWTLGTVALFRPRKGIEVLLEALAILKQQGFPVQLQAIGAFEDPAYQRQLLARVEHLGLGSLVNWCGFTRDVTAALLKTDLLVLPSLFGEGLPMVVLEAMAAGVPVVATDVEGIPEAIRDGLDGVIAHAGDPGHLARAIASVISGQVDWSALRRTALARQAEKFSDRSMAAGVAAVYREVLASAPRLPNGT
jgi:glycosyltransferase involved in cell wall biosynthesis